MAIGVIINDEPNLVLFGATKISPIEATLVSYIYGQGTDPIPITGTIQLAQGGRALIITPDGSLGSEPCSFSQYLGTFRGVVGG